MFPVNLLLHTGYASSDHTHADYASVSHVHEGYSEEEINDLKARQRKFKMEF